MTIGASFMRRLAGFTDRHPGAVTLLFGSACLSAALIHGRFGRYDMSVQTLAPKNTAEFAAFEEFRAVFGDDSDTYVIAFKDDPLITNENLAMIERITERLALLADTVSITSLTNVLDIHGSDGELDVSEFFDGLPQSEEGLATLRRSLIEDPLVGGNLISRDGRTAALVARLSDASNDPEKRFLYFDSVETILSEEGREGIEFVLAGEAYMNRALTRYMIRDTTFFIPIAIAVQCALLWLAFGRMRAVWLPITPVAIAAVLTMGSLTAFGVPMSLLTGQGVLSTLIIVIGLSNAVHLLSRYDEEMSLDPGATRSATLAKAMEQVGSACLLTSVTTAIGFISLGLADIPAIRDFGCFGALGVGFAFACAVVLLPALIGLTERLRKSRVRASGAAPWLEASLAVVSRTVLRYPRQTIAVCVAAFVFWAVAISGARIDGGQTGELKTDDPAVAALDFLEENLGGTYPLEIVVRGKGPDSIKNPDLLAGMEVIRAGLEELSEVTKVVGPAQFIKKMNRAMNEDDDASYRLPGSRNAVAQYLLLFEMAGSDSEFDRMVNYDYSVARLTAILKDVSREEYEAVILRLHELAAATFDSSVQVYESGALPLWHTVTELLISTLLRSLFFAMPLIFVIIGLTFRSVRLGILSTLPNLFPLTVGLGLMGIADIPLRLSTIIAFPLAFGLAIDDTIHFLARYRSEVADGRSPEQAVATTIATTGRAMVLTTIFLVAGYSVLFASNFLGIVHVAILVCVILVAALFGDLFLLPALLITFQPTPRESEQPEAVSSALTTAWAERQSIPRA